MISLGHGFILADTIDVLVLAGLFAVLSLSDDSQKARDRVEVSGGLAVPAIILVGPVQVAVGVLLAELATSLVLNRVNARRLSLRLASVLACATLVDWLQLARFPQETVGHFVVAGLVVLAYETAMMLNSSGAKSRLDVVVPTPLLGNVFLRLSVIASDLSLALLALLIYPIMHNWGFALILLLLLTTRESFSMLLDVRMATRATIEAMVRALEAEHPATQGHARRVAIEAVRVGKSIGLRGKALERLAYAALLHDVGRIGVEEQDSRWPRVRASRVIAAGTPLDWVVPILRVLEGRLDQATHVEAVMAYIVLRSSMADDRKRGARGGDCKRGGLDERISGLVGRDLSGCVDGALAE